MVIEDKQVFVNEKKRTVVTVLTDEFGERFEGKAKCHPNDVFDEEIGKVISFKKAEIRANKSSISEGKKELKRLLKYAAELEKFIDDHSTKVEKIKAGLEKYIKNKLS